MGILLIEDERPLAVTIMRILQHAGWTVEWEADGARGYEAAQQRRYDLLILDVLLPGKSGWDVLRDLRAAKSSVPILMLTAMDETADKVRGLDLGADDYLAKPFDAAELTARVKALLRRDKANKGDVIQIDGLTLDRRTRRVERDGREIALTRREYELLEALALNEGRVMSREAILAQVWGDEEAYSNTVDVFIAHLRKKVDAPFGRRLIQTAVGFGYVMRAGPA